MADILRSRTLTRLRKPMRHLFLKLHPKVLFVFACALVSVSQSVDQKSSYWQTYVMQERSNQNTVISSDKLGSR